MNSLFSSNGCVGASSAVAGCYINVVSVSPHKKDRNKTQTTQCPYVSSKKIQSTHYDSVASIAPTGAEASRDATCRAISRSDGLKRENALAHAGATKQVHDQLFFEC